MTIKSWARRRARKVIDFEGLEMVKDGVSGSDARSNQVAIERMKGVKSNNRLRRMLLKGFDGHV